MIKHDDLVGLANGDRTESAKGNPFKVFKATLQQHILNMNRFATIIYPKDIASILMQGDIGPKLKVVEGGLGSGALAMSILRAIGLDGQLVTYEINEAAIKCSTKNIKAFLGETPYHVIKQQDIYEGIGETDVDRVVLDVPEPWHVVPHAANSLVDGGLFIAYIPTVIQVHEVVKALRAHPAMYTTWSLEILERPWYVTEESIRPDHRMTAHTGFLVFSRRSARWLDKDGASKTKKEETPSKQITQ